MEIGEQRDLREEETREAIAGGGVAPPAPTVEELNQQRVESGDVGFEAQAARSASPFRAAVRRFLRDKRAVFCLALVLFIILFSFIFPPFYQHMGGVELGGATGLLKIHPEQYHTYDFQDLSQSDVNGTLISFQLTWPFMQLHFGSPDAAFHPLGTNTLGQDILARLLAGINISIELAVLVEFFDVGLGLLLGTLAGWYSGWLGTILDRFTDIMFAFPGLLLIVLMGASLGPIFDTAFANSLGPVYARVFMLVLALGILAWPLMMRFVRGQTLTLKEQQYVEAARVAGTPDRKIIMQHVIPNLMNVVVVASTLSVLGTIIGEAGLSELGVGIRPPGSSLGLMISDGQPFVYINPGEMLWPVLVLVVIVVCLSFVGDGVRDAFDPRTKD
jgi:ABC-type dipeptide/oligopeptide/nickel transport system permease subunit